MKRLLTLTTCIAMVLTAMSQQTKLLTAEKHNEYGLIYTLPITAFQIDVEAVKEVKVAGPFSKYAKIFTSEQNVVAKDEVAWTIEKVSVRPYCVPDPDNKYLMQLKPGSTTFLSVAEDGMLLAINKEVESPELETATQNIIIGTPVKGNEYLEFVNEDFIAAQSSYKKAQLLAEELIEIRDAKISLTRGTADAMPSDGRQLELMLASLDNQENALTNAFTGASWKEKIVSSYTFIPEEDGKYILCKLSSTDGLIDPKSKSGEALYITVTTTQEAQLPADSKGEVKKVPKDAVMYCVPGFAQISISYAGKNLYQKEHALSQMGLTFGLNPSIFTDKKEPSFAVFDPATGALLELGTIK